MTAARQHRALGACAHSSDSEVIVQVGKEITSMTTREARIYARCLLRAIVDAEIAQLELELGRAL